jgi:hypothetical protein
MSNNPDVCGALHVPQGSVEKLRLATYSYLMLLCVPNKPSAAALERLEAPPLDDALQAAGNEAFCVFCRLSA